MRFLFLLIEAWIFDIALLPSLVCDRFAPECPSILIFMKASHPPVVSFIYWSHVTFLTYKASVQSTNTFPARIDIEYTNLKRKGGFLTEIPQQKIPTGKEFWACDLPTQIFFALQLLIPWRIWPSSWLHKVLYLLLSLHDQFSST